MELVPLPVMRPLMPPPAEFLPRFEKIQESGIFSNRGPQLLELEHRFAERFNVRPSQIAILGNATLALSGLVQLLGAAKRWLLPSWTFAASAHAVIQGGGLPFFVDVDEFTHRVADEVWQDATHAFVTLPFGAGVPPAWFREGKFPTIVDAAASMSAVTDLSGLRGGSSFVFSLHATKYLGAGEGAVVVSGSEKIIDNLRAWANFGFEGSRTSMTVGTNAKMSEYQAAIAHCALDFEQAQAPLWAELRALSLQTARSFGIDVAALSSNSIGPYWIVQFESAFTRDRVERELAASGIDSRRWWSHGCHEMPAFETIPANGALPATKKLAATTLGLPYFLGMQQNDFRRIQSALREALPSSAIGK